MKKAIFILLGCVGALACNAQNATQPSVPAAVKTAFANQYPGMTAVKWEKEGSAYEAEFMRNGVENNVLMDATGKVLEVEMKIPESELPQAVKDAVRQVAGDAKIVEASKITVTGGKVKYEVAANHHEYLFDASGATLQGSGDDDGDHGAEGSDDDGDDGSDERKGGKGSDAKNRNSHGG